VAAELPGHIKKAFRSIERFLPVVDFLIELLDARMPSASRIHGLVDRLGKPSVVVLGKADLADPAETRAWCELYQRQGLVCLPLNAKDHGSIKKLAQKIRAFAATLSRGPRTRTLRRMMVVGIPNVGKSTLINALAGRKAARVANLPGVTRNIQWVKLEGDLELLDLPGILDFSAARRSDILRLINCMPGVDDDPGTLADRLYQLLQQDGRVAKLLPGLPAVRTVEEFLAAYAQDRRFLGAGGHPDHRRAALDFVKRFQNGSFGGITLESPTRLLPTSTEIAPEVVPEDPHGS